jgi:hypothetical protein
MPSGRTEQGTNLSLRRSKEPSSSSLVKDPG